MKPDEKAQKVVAKANTLPIENWEVFQNEEMHIFLDDESYMNLEIKKVSPLRQYHLTITYKKTKIFDYFEPFNVDKSGIGPLYDTVYEKWVNEKSQKEKNNREIGTGILENLID